MTGFGSISQEKGALHLSIRIRSVNHRYLDLVIRMPEELRPLEIPLRERVGKRVSRGRLEIRIEVDDRRDRPVTFHINEPWIQAIRQASEALAETELELGRLRMGDLLRMPDAIRILPAGDEDDNELPAAVVEAFEEALGALEASRVSEGAKLEAVLRGQIDSLAQLVREISEDHADVQADQDTRLRSRIQDLLGDADLVDSGRIEQEVAMLAERADVREELDRLSSHLSQFRDTMDQPGAVGKKLDFIAQEIARELTTLGAKFRQSGGSPRHVEAKLICEQIREQIQNIE